MSILKLDSSTVSCKEEKVGRYRVDATVRMQPQGKGKYYSRSLYATVTADKIADMQWKMITYTPKGGRIAIRNFRAVDGLSACREASSVLQMHAVDLAFGDFKPDWQKAIKQAATPKPATKKPVAKKKR